MPIAEKIPQQMFELIRDRIGAILVEEFASQVDKQTDDPDAKIIMQKTEVWKERILPFQQDELFMITPIWFGAGYTNQNPTYAEAKNQYFLDCFGRMKSNDNNSGDMEAAIQLQRLVGIVRYIFEHPDYRQLGLDKGIIKNSHVSDIKRTEIKRQDEGGAVAMYRIILDVNAGEFTQGNTEILIKANETTVTIDEGPKGYQYIYEKT